MPAGTAVLRCNEASMKGGASERTQGRGRPGGGRPRRGPAAADRRQLRPLRRRRQAGGLAGHGEQARQAGARVRLRAARPRGRSAGRDRHPLAHLLHDQADHLGRRHDAVRGGRAAADRPGQQVHPVLRRPARLHRRLGPEPAHRPRHRADAGLAPAHPHLRPHLRVPPGAPGGRHLPRGRVRRRRGPRAWTWPRRATPGRRCRCCSSPGRSGTTVSPPTCSAAWSRSPPGSRSTTSSPSASSARSA